MIFYKFCFNITHTTKERILVNEDISKNYNSNNVPCR